MSPRSCLPSRRLPRLAVVLHRVAAIALLIVLTGALSALSGTAHAADDNAAKATVLAEQAMKFHFGGKPALAIALYKQAYKLDPQPGYLYSAGRAAHKAGLLQEADRNYTAVLALVDEKSPFHAKAQQRLGEVKEALKKADAKAAKAKEPAQEPEKPASTTPAVAKKPEKPAAKQPTPAIKPPVRVTEKVPAWHGTAGFAAIGVGVVAAGGAVLLAMGAMNQAEKLDGFKGPDTGKYDSTKIDRDTLRSEETSHNLKVIGAYGLGVVGLAAVGVGAKLLLSDTKTVALHPAGRGLRLTVSF